MSLERRSILKNISSLLLGKEWILKNSICLNGVKSIFRDCAIRERYFVGNRVREIIFLQETFKNSAKIKNIYLVKIVTENVEIGSAETHFIHLSCKALDTIPPWYCLTKRCIKQNLKFNTIEVALK